MAGFGKGWFTNGRQPKVMKCRDVIAVRTIKDASVQALFVDWMNVGGLVCYNIWTTEIRCTSCAQLLAPKKFEGTEIRGSDLWKGKSVHRHIDIDFRGVEDCDAIEPYDVMNRWWVVDDFFPVSMRVRKGGRLYGSPE